MPKTFGELLRVARTARQITLRKLGELVGLKPSFLSALENGRRLPPKDETKIENLALVLGVDRNQLKEAASIQRSVQGSNIFNKLIASDGDLAWSFYRATEESSEEDIKRALKDALTRLKKD